MTSRSWLKWLLLLSIPACAAPPDWKKVRAHVLSIDAEGRGYDPESGRKEDVDKLVSDLLKAADDATKDRQVRRLLIHVHGGLNTASASLDTAYNATLRMDEEKDESEKYHPIFVTWPSGFFRTYGEHLFKLHQGRHAPVLGPVMSPVVLVTDVAGAVAMAPLNFVYQMGNDCSVGIKVGFDGNFLTSWSNADRISDALAPAGKPFQAVRCGDYSRGYFTQGSRFVWYLITLAPSLVVSTVGLGGMGQGSWEGMLHRANNLFHAYNEFDVRTVKGGKKETLDAVTTPPTGAFAVFLRKLAEHIQANPDVQYEVVLVGHSMGAIILNEALRFLEDEDARERAKNETTKELRITHVVYMAPACSIGEASQSVVPYLETHRGTQFHLLTLHPIAEADELNGYGFAPRGSLLEWIDNYFSRPTSPLERRFGKWLNVMQALHMFHTVADRVTIKAFGVDGDSMPQMHGQFNDCPFWRADFWDPAGPMLWSSTGALGGGGPDQP